MYLTGTGFGDRRATALDDWSFGEISKPATPASAVEIYVAVEGVKQGKFKGETSAKGFQGQSRVVRFQYELTSPRDRRSGSATGGRVHKPIVITREPGMASPQFFQ